MLSEMMKRVQEYLEPYTLEKFVLDHNPQDNYDVERLEKVWQRYMMARAFSNRY
jgi:hypothetical protein